MASSTTFPLTSGKWFEWLPLIKALLLSHGCLNVATGELKDTPVGKKPVLASGADAEAESTRPGSI
jgi:hypothetical protein